MKISSSRSGRYVRQKDGYDAFIPAPLPPNPPVQIGEELQILLSNADRFLGRLEGSISTLPNPDLFVFMYIRKEAVLSSQIEGTQSTLQDLLEAEAEIMHPGIPKDVEEVLNYIAAIKEGLKNPDATISVSLIKSIHKRLLRHGRGASAEPGQVRTRQNWIGSDNCSIYDAIFVPPPPDEVPYALKQLVQFCNNPGKLSLLVWISLVHVQFETIHPFIDGNGRMGRLLIAFLLRKFGILSEPVLYISLFFKQHRSQYYDMLQSVRDNGAWEEWVAFFLQGVVEISKDASNTARAILCMREEHRGIITESFGRSARMAYLLLEHLYTHPIISVKDLVKLTGMSYTSSNRLISKMVEHGILTQIKGKTRNRSFIYKKYINLFHNSGN